jgi:SAM-dependent methyltransferase
VLLDAHHLPFVPESFSCVVMTEVLEHVYAPYRVLEEIHRILEPGGSLVISVPNHMNFARFMQHLRNKDGVSNDAHLSAFDFYALKQLLAFVGFEVEVTCAEYIHVPLLKRIFRNDRMQNRLQKRWRYFGNRLIVRAVKTEDSLWSRL